jgi:hypothetical protein
MKTIADLKVGDEVWITDTANGRGRIEESTVSKIGTKLIHVGNWSFRKDGGRANDDYGHSLLIPDLEAYQNSKRVEKILGSIKWGIEIGRANDISIEDVLLAAKLLKITVKD